MAKTGKAEPRAGSANFAKQSSAHFGIESVSFQQETDVLSDRTQKRHFRALSRCAASSVASKFGDELAYHNQSRWPAKS